MINKQLFSERLRELFYIKDCNAIELEKSLNVGRATVSRWRNGHTLPNNSQIKEIANFFNVNYDWLIGKSDSKNLELSKVNEISLISILISIREFARCNNENKTVEHIDTILNKITI